MLETYLRPIYQKALVKPIAIGLIRFWRWQPQTITLLSCISGVTVAPLLIMGYVWAACVLLLISGYLDTLDGTMARLSGQTSGKGAVFDIMSDRVVEFSVILGLYGIDPSTRGWLALGMLGSCYLCITSFLVVGIFSQNNTEKSFYYSPGLIERAEAFAFFIAMMIFPTWFTVVASLFIVLVLYTTWVRIWQFISTIASK